MRGLCFLVVLAITGAARAETGRLIVSEVPPPPISDELLLGSAVQAIRIRDMTGQFSSYALLKKDLLATGMSQRDVDRLLRADATPLENGGASVRFSEELWKAFPPSYREMILNNYRQEVGKDPVRHGLRADLVVGPSDDLIAIAALYGRPENRDSIVQKLESYRRSAGGTEFAIPLQEILPKVIRDKVGTYETCMGPSCIGASVAVADGDVYKVESFPLPGAVKRLSEQGYQAIENASAREPLDVYVYFSPDGEMPHFATYITTFNEREIVFTKGGRASIQPYQFQWKEVAEERYYGPGFQYAKAVLRRTGAVSPLVITAKLFWTGVSPAEQDKCLAVLERLISGKR